MYEFRGFHIPDYMMDGIERYVNDGIPPGGFLTAIITNDLHGAVSAADDENIKNIPAYVAYFYNKTPAACWGSIAAMNAWAKKVSLERAYSQKVNLEEEL